MKALRITAPLLLLSMSACAWWMAGRPSLETLDQLIFSHTLHSENDAECDACHGEIATATDTSKGHLPTHDNCAECHEIDDNCSMCHSNSDDRRGRPEHSSALGFSHAAHLERVGETLCASCHEVVMASEEVPAGRPTMDTCLACHNHAEDYAQARCLHCHPSMQQQPLRAVAEYTHAGDWMELHGALARSQGDTCQQCHVQTLCSECHSRVAPAANIRLYPEAVDRPLLHRGDWLSVHPMEAGADPASCTRCHAPSSCESCHAASGVAPTSTSITAPHPPGYALRGSAHFHGDDARLRIETCAACHDQGPASNCVECHRVGGVGGNPHPKGWNERFDGETNEKAMCAYCHPTAP